jgi:tetratricopeptide (TPR) repeat protein
VPNSAAERLALAHQLESQGQALEALKLYDAVLKEDPANVEALTYRGWLLKLAGLADPAQESLDRAVAIDPSYPDAHFFRGMLLFQNRNDPAAAIPEFEKYLALNPPAETVVAVQRVLDQARQAANAVADAPAAGTASTTVP